MLFFAGFIVFKNYNKPEDAKNETEQLALELEESFSELEPAAGSEEKPEEETKPAEAEAKDAEKKPAVDDELPSYVSKERPSENIPQLTMAGKDLLQQMAARRAELDEWKKDLELRASLIEASSRKLDDKIAKLEQLKKVTQQLLDEYKVEDDKKMLSLIKVYENMKPKDAAKVFDQLEMPVLLEIVRQMSARRLSAVLAKMNAGKAKEVTEKLMENRDLAKM